MTYGSGLYHWLALLVTLVVEGTGMIVWVYVLQLPRARSMLLCLAVNLIVHTLFWYSQPLFLYDWPAGLYRAEVLVILLEGAAYAYGLARRGWHPWLMSLTLNVASAGAGLWLWQVLL